MRTYIQQQEKELKDQSVKLQNYDAQKSKIANYELELANNQNVLKEI